MSNKPLNSPLQPGDGHPTPAKAWGHFRTITRHKILVGKLCFRVGLYRQGFMHDWSKYAPVEFCAGVKYYQGYRSPNAAERLDKGYSAAWLHHKGRNKHHFEYWMEPSIDGSGQVLSHPMPMRYVVEMFCDRVAASKIYKGADYTDRTALEYLLNSKEYAVMHPDTYTQIVELLTMLAEQGEEHTLNYIKHQIVEKL